APAGTASRWGYTPVPPHPVADAGGDLSGKGDERETEAFLTRVERELESRAPGFIDRVVGRSVLTPPMLEAADANLVGGAVNGGRRSCTSSSSSAPPWAWGGPRHRSVDCSSRRRPPIPAAGSTAPAAPTPLAPRWRRMRGGVSSPRCRGSATRASRRRHWGG